MYPHMSCTSIYMKLLGDPSLCLAASCSVFAIISPNRLPMARYPTILHAKNVKRACQNMTMWLIWMGCAEGRM